MSLCFVLNAVHAPGHAPTELPTVTDLKPRSEHSDSPVERMKKELQQSGANSEDDEQLREFTSQTIQFGRELFFAGIMCVQPYIAGAIVKRIPNKEVYRFARWTLWNHQAIAVGIDVLSYAALYRLSLGRFHPLVIPLIVKGVASAEIFRGIERAWETAEKAIPSFYSMNFPMPFDNDQLTGWGSQAISLMRGLIMLGGLIRSGRQLHNTFSR